MHKLSKPDVSWCVILLRRAIPFALYQRARTRIVCFQHTGWAAFPTVTEEEYEYSCCTNCRTRTYPSCLVMCFIFLGRAIALRSTRARTRLVCFYLPWIEPGLERFAQGDVRCLCCRRDANAPLHCREHMGATGRREGF